MKSHGVPGAEGVEMMQKTEQGPAWQQQQQQRQRLPEINSGGCHSYYNSEPRGIDISSSPESKFSLPPPVRGRVQLRALLRRQYLHKASNLHHSLITFRKALLMLEYISSHVQMKAQSCKKMNHSVILKTASFGRKSSRPIQSDEF